MPIRIYGRVFAIPFFIAAMAADAACRTSKTMIGISTMFIVGTAAFIFGLYYLRKDTVAIGYIGDKPEADADEPEADADKQ